MFHVVPWPALLRMQNLITARIRFTCAWWLALLVPLLFAAFANAEVPVPQLRSRVTDLTHTLTPEQRQTLETRLAAFEARKGAQIAVLLVPTTQPESIEQFARRVLDEWKLGRKGIDDGALLLIAMQDRKLRIETQYGLEGPLPDAICKRIIDEIVTPRFKQKDFYGGIAAGIERMISVVNGEPLPAPAPQQGRPGSGASGSEGLLIFGFVLVFVVGAFLRSVLGRFGGAAATAGIGGTIAWFLLGTAIAAGTAAVVLLILTLLVNFSGASGLAGGRRARGWSGGYWGGSSWGGGSSGGWSGGGGFGGGGGSSGSW